MQKWVEVFVLFVYSYKTANMVYLLNVLHLYKLLENFVSVISCIKSYWVKSEEEFKENLKYDVQVNGFVIRCSYLI